jgi:hypothetical protein
MLPSIRSRHRDRFADQSGALGASSTDDREENPSERSRNRDSLGVLELDRHAIGEVDGGIPRQGRDGRRRRRG